MKGFMFFIIFVLIVIGAIVWVGKDYIFPVEWKYRLTVEIETPDGIKTGSAVRKIRASKNFAGVINNAAPIVMYEVMGEAVAIPLGERILFISIGDDAYEQVYAAFGYASGDDWKQIQSVLRLEKGERAELKKRIGNFYTFMDEADPVSLERLTSQDFARVFGEGVFFKGATVEIVDDVISWRVATLLPPDFTIMIRPIGIEYFIRKGS